MSTVKVIPYTESCRQLWDNAVAESRNGTFLLLRNYMDYHRRRFTDHSLLMLDSHDKVVALLPAAVPAGATGDVVASHPGLTYGGLILAPRTAGEQVMQCLEAAAEVYSKNGFRQLVYKPIPYIYHRYPAQDDIYALWRLGARMTCVNLSASMQPGNAPAPDTNTRRNMRRGALEHLHIGVSTDIEAFYALLAKNLMERHEATPVHSLEELRQLMKLFPENIVIVSANSPADGAMMAAVVLYITHTCTHTQYICSSPRGRECGAVAVLFDYLIKNCRTQWLDFGTSNEDHGKILNAGLFRQKNGFGARGTAYCEFTLSL